MMSGKMRVGLRLLAIAALALALGGCGGGGGGGGSGGGTTGSGGGGGGGTTVPAAPASVGAVAGNGQVTVSWAASSGATSYNLYWSTAAGVSPASGTKVAGVASPYVQTGLTNGTTYYYVVTAVNAAGESLPSTQVSASPTAGAVTTYTISGDVVGLAAGQSVTLQNNGTDNLAVNANGTFTFATGLAANANYNVTVLTQPANGQTCSIAPNVSTTNSSGVGTVSTANVDTVRVTCYAVTTFAGSGVAGWGDATGEDAVFRAPSSVAFDSAGNMFVTESNLVREITPSGAVTTLAGSGMPGYVDATRGAAQFNFTTTGLVSTPAIVGIGVDTTGNVYVSDSGNNVIRKISPAGVVTTFAGSGVAGYADLTGTAAQFSNPQGLAVDSLNNVYVSDTGNSVIRKITPAGVVSTVAGTAGFAGYVDATGTAAQFNGPEGIAVDASGNLYVADFYNGAVRKITPAGAVSTLAGGWGNFWYYLDATGTAAKFAGPNGIAVDTSGNVYVTELLNGGVRMITPSGVVSTVAGQKAATFMDGPSSIAQFKYPRGVAADAAGNLYVADGDNDRIRMVSAAPYGYKVMGHLAGLMGASSVALQDGAGATLNLFSNGVFAFPALTNISGTTSYTVTVSTQPPGQTCAVANATGGFVSGDILSVKVNCATVTTAAGTGALGLMNGAAASATFRFPSVAYYVSGAVFDSLGNMYVADSGNNVIRMITPSGTVSTYAGTGTPGLVNGPAASAQFNFPLGLAIDASNNIYVFDGNNAVIRMISSTGTVSTFAGAGGGGYLDGPAASAKFSTTGTVAVDSTTGTVYVADGNNNVIRKIAGGNVTTFAGTGPSGTGSGSGYVNGTGTAAKFWGPYGVAVDANSGNVYVADTLNSAIRKITPAGVVTTLVGAPEGVASFGYRNSSGTGAAVNNPYNLTVDGAGNIYVADTGNNAIRVITPTGTADTLAGPLELASGYSVSAATTAGNTNGNGLSARFNVPHGLAVDAGRNVYVIDGANNVIRKITP